MNGGVKMSETEREELKQLVDDQLRLKKAQLVFASNLDEMRLLAVVQKLISPE